MAEIKVLSADVFNRIAAGEVVERPASVVKELVENSIDAGAKRITVEIRGGGIEYIRVTDDGKGIPAGQLKTALLPHATSKISALDDLGSISTLGFRGEALPSIASVSVLTITSRAAGSEMGAVYKVDNGRELDFGEMGAAAGTTVLVEDLFGKIPARKKFLSKESTEENAVTNLVLRCILANPSVAFTYISGGKIVYSSDGDGVESAIKSVYGAEYLAQTVKIQSTLSDITLSGYICKPSFSKHSKTFQTLIVNGRYVVSDEISYLVYGCYQKYLMKRQFPTYVLYLNVPYDLVDVNVHPAKTEIKFAVPSLIKKIVADAIRAQVLDAVSVPKELDGLFDYEPVPTTRNFSAGYTGGEPERSFSAGYAPKEATARMISKGESDSVNAFFSLISGDAGETNKQERAEKPSAANDSFDDVFTPSGSAENKSEEHEEAERGYEVHSGSAERFGARGVIERAISEPFPKGERMTFRSPDFAGPYTRQGETQMSFSVPAEARVAGKLFNTYIIVEYADAVYFIDQHAAHEKILYDRLMAEAERGFVSVQRLLVPYEFSVSPEEMRLLTENKMRLECSGFGIAKGSGGDKLQLRAVPARCVGMNVQAFVSDLLKGVSDESGDRIIPRTLVETIMQAACKAAAKGEDDLSDMEIEKLLKQMSDETRELYCPHGRPIVIKISHREIEKWFKRIV